jgi:hypothetical protein
MKQVKKHKGLLLLLVQLCFLQGFAQLSRGEYFFDTDPGVGKALALPAANIIRLGNDSATFSGDISIPGSLPPGAHVVYVRFQQSNGSWSSYQQQRFFISTANGYITSGEYFFDTDPGAGKGTAIALSGNSDSASFAGAISTSGLVPGFHDLYVRTQTTAGNWSLYEKKRIKVLAAGNAITQAEYFYDTDPGIGAGTALAITSGNSDSALISASISSIGLSSGYHNLYIRVKGAGGWSIYEKQRIFVNAVLTKAEYFIDSDPGVGNGKAVTLSNLGEYAGAITITPCLAVGQHTAYVRAMNSDKVWGLYDSVGFTVNPTPVTASVHYPGPGPNGTPLRLTGAGGCSATYMYTNITAGTAETSNPQFLVPNGSTSEFQIKDNAGNITSLTFNAPADPTGMTTITNANNSSQAVTLDGWNEWVYVQDASGKIIAAVNDGGRDLGSVTAEDSINTNGVRQASALGGYYLDRNWKIRSTQTPANATIGVRLYFASDEYNSLVAADPTVTGTSSLQLTKYNGINENLSVYDNATTGYKRYNTISLTPFAGSTTNGYILQTQVPGFSEFYLGSSANIILPLQLITFNAKLAGVNAFLNWKVASVTNVRGFEVQRSSDGVHFTTQGFVAISDADSYAFSEILPGSGRYYYRLRIIDNDGRSNLSLVRLLLLNDKPSTIIYPNPVSAELHIAAGSLTFQYRLMDAQNRVLASGRATSALSLDMRSYASGIYFMELQYNGVVQVEKIMKQ